MAADDLSHKHDARPAIHAVEPLCLAGQAQCALSQSREPARSAPAFAGSSEASPRPGDHGRIDPRRQGALQAAALHGRQLSGAHCCPRYDGTGKASRRSGTTLPSRGSPRNSRKIRNVRPFFSCTIIRSPAGFRTWISKCARGPAALLRRALGFGISSASSVATCTDPSSPAGRYGCLDLPKHGHADRAAARSERGAGFV